MAHITRMTSTQLPSRTTVLVIGGGPAGAYAASALAREGIEATVLEAAKFPRYHIGESMLPSLIPFMRFIDAEEKLRAAKFAQKRGAAVKFNQHKQEGYTDFVRGDERNASFNVRSEFDNLLLRHAESSGAKVFEETKVTEIKFAESTGTELRPISALYTCNNGEAGEISFDYLVDASGRNGVMSTKYLKNRKMNGSLHNLACWAYWTGAGMYMPGTERHNAPWFESLTDESGWGWFIPLHNGTVSVGIVMDSSISAKKKADGRKASPTGEHTLKDHYLEQMKFVPSMRKLLEGATLKEDGHSYQVRSAADFSYAADKYAGDHYRIVGDASAFIDPFFSSGVHLALLGGLTSAATIAASIRGHCTEQEAWEFHDVKVATAYTRFLLVVMSAYKQIRNQSTAVLADVDEVNFDRAFDILRPVIQGTADVGKKLTEDELERTMDFCKDVFAPTDPEMIEAVGARLRPELLAPNAPIMSNEQIQDEAQGDEEIEIVLHRVNARKPVNQLYQGPANLQAGDVGGFIAHLQHGELGLVRM
ncbi:FAD/NAD(P)-binding domain-containing protein [Macrolepiota fuliginosa MF-IS2]|uniref:FAD/NAD(P)-binding domain-containing protein n=1 Tax=Macrolepiota fuliginosa MF-IS2 TaxID=1400762 RepID=A0A9P6C447_9AGAR|nr:FAD/NAD(P)-binding domain-containing protein [Macrolepiota fuliginosa MF-IS2]